MKISEVLDKLKKAPDDTKYSKRMFKEYEEGKEDQIIKQSNSRHRRDWLIIADIYHGGNYNQKFHLQNYLEFRLQDGLTKDDLFETNCYRYLRNAALILYIREVIFEESKEKLEETFNRAKKYYENNGRVNNCPDLRK